VPVVLPRNVDYQTQRRIRNKTDRLKNDEV
jgi:hypothetical protein